MRLDDGRGKEWRWSGEPKELVVYERGFNTHIVSGYLNGELHTYCARGMNYPQLPRTKPVKRLTRPMCQVCMTLARQKGEVE